MVERGDWTLSGKGHSIKKLSGEKEGEFSTREYEVTGERNGLERYPPEREANPQR